MLRNIDNFVIEMKVNYFEQFLGRIPPHLCLKKTLCYARGVDLNVFFFVLKQTDIIFPIRINQSAFILHTLNSVYSAL